MCTCSYRREGSRPNPLLLHLHLPNFSATQSMSKLAYSEADPGVTDGYVQLLYSILDTCQLHREHLIQLQWNLVTDLCSILPSFQSGFRTLLRKLVLQGSKGNCRIPSIFEVLYRVCSLAFQILALHISKGPRKILLAFTNSSDPLWNMAEDVSHKTLVQVLTFYPALKVSLARLLT
jgi:hypothetical protein